ncbi:MAG: hypothetical protein JRI54_00430 [Deltaproteobacteria bacterium]|nr:hypothetical protein [Deltaproteobacteria bacterium]
MNFHNGVLKINRISFFQEFLLFNQFTIFDQKAFFNDNNAIVEILKFLYRDFFVLKKEGKIIALKGVAVGRWHIYLAHAEHLIK